MSVDKIKILLIGNRNRGSNATGLYSVGSVEGESISYIEKVSKSPLISLESQALIEDGDFDVVMLHNRAPSPGTDLTIAAAQPIEIGNIVIAHNGTIYNQDKLAKDYGVENLKKDTDTMILAKILEKREFGVLNDYNGAASLVWCYKDEPNAIYVFRGESRNNDYSTIDSEERPLYFYDSSDGMYISSEADSLNIIANDKDDLIYVKEVEANKVHKITTEQSRFNSIFDVDRSKSKQTKNWINTNKGNKKDNKNKSKKIDFNKALPAKLDKFTSDFHEIELAMNTRIVNNLSKTAIHRIPGHNKISQERVNTLIVKNRVYFYKCRYWINNTTVNGVLTLNDDGEISPNGTKYYFFEGYLIKSLYAHSKIIHNGKNLDLGTAESLLELAWITEQPIIRIDNDGELTFHKSASITFAGIYEPLFVSTKYYEFQDGSLIDMYDFRLSDIKEGDTLILNDSDDEVTVSENIIQYTFFTYFKEGLMECYGFEHDVVSVNGKFAKSNSALINDIKEVNEAVPSKGYVFSEVDVLEAVDEVNDCVNDAISTIVSINAQILPFDDPDGSLANECSIRINNLQWIKEYLETLRDE